MAEVIKISLKIHLPIKVLAKAHGISQSKLMLGFKQQFGSGVYHYLRLLRMEKARELMLNELPITQILREIGYEHESNFNIAFKRYIIKRPRFGKPPYCHPTQKRPQKNITK
ncbi:helix-turn-helix transcriptional regulator [Paraflavitalea speifideaquila]|uniref:helix-turn-helix transcriptional regulator n=1 Tax=Paraflavitalea speifideaquila TaxID=3076558 RepID=UPI0028E696DD|nr:helix-turn-helix transcriptional regulator [Paraflavitalea speifideiaquila]